jgi:hypothetical protein
MDENVFLQARNVNVIATPLNEWMEIRMTRAHLAATLGLVAALALTGCAGASPAGGSGAATPTSTPSPIQTNVIAVPQDAAAFAQLEKVAPTSLKLEGGTVTGTTCWTPSEHLFTDPSVASASTWKVLCRVHYDLKGTARYQDTTCIGDFHKTPMLTRCYVWEIYSGVPGYADGDKLASPAPTPLP